MASQQAYPRSSAPQLSPLVWLDPGSHLGPWTSWLLWAAPFSGVGDVGSGVQPEQRPAPGGPGPHHTHLALCAGSSLASNVCRKITGQLTSAIAQQEDVAVQLEALDILSDMLSRCGRPP